MITQIVKEILAADKQINMNNLALRIISGTVLGGIFLLSIFYMRPLFNIILYVIATLMLMEWYDMTKVSVASNITGLMLISISIASLLLLSYIDYNGWLLISYFIIIWSVDIMAMFGGKLIGGYKLAPRVSPNKTISGLLCGIFSAALFVNILSMISPSSIHIYEMFSQIELTVYTLMFGVLAQISDLTVSVFKRKFGIKDTGKIIPGHGGVLDRFDSIILTAPIFVLFTLTNFVNII